MAEARSSSAWLRPNIGSARATEKPDPILDVLKQKILPEKETEGPVSGLLYFPMEKQKVKDLELRYAITGDKITMRFRQEK